MPRGPRSGRQAEKNRYRSTYLLELARGSSHIASTLGADSRQAAIAEVLCEFGLQYGKDKLPVFRALLAESLEDRDNPDAARAVLSFAPRRTL
ncbi:hypothetical protein [Paraburkholderia sp. JPY419]|uniref:hypothetical protein n=1 Tax=Paraburkholderia sp. JPY419 TaxID=667660 RepID=UPI003D1AF671